MRTADDIAEHIKRVNQLGDDVFGFQMSDLIAYLPYDLAKIYLEDDVVEEQWNSSVVIPDRELIIKQMRDYMDFAWNKALNHRGLSANRSIDHFRAWLWLLEDENLLDGIDYKQYGTPMLAAICEKYVFQVPDGNRVMNMIQGIPCRPACDEGCSK